MSGFQKRVRILIVQPSSLCNLNCSYCYIPSEERRDSSLMSSAVLDKIFSLALQSPLLSQECVVNWHAGEPLAAGIPFYETALQLIHKHNTNGVSVKNTIQTNGVLINEKWCEFFLKNNIGVGLSIDGPEFLHDASRRTWKNRGSFNLAMRGVRLLQEHNIHFGNIAVLTKHSLQYPREMYDFFLSSGFRSVAFNIEEKEAAHSNSSLQDEEVRESYASFMDTFFACNSDGAIDIRELNHIKRFIYNKKKDKDFVSYSTEVQDFSILTFNKTGDVTPYAPELSGGTAHDKRAFVIGNVLNAPSLEVLLDSPVYVKMRDEIRRGVEKCAQECAYFDYCGGGNPSNKFYENGDFASSETMHCRLHKQTLFDVALNHLDRLGMATKGGL